MGETAQEYTQRLLNNVGGSNPMEILNGTPGRVESVIHKLESSGKKASEGRWGAAQILSHFAEGEMVLSYRLRRILAGSGQAIEAYDQDEWVKNATYLQSNIQMALSVFQTLRRANVALLRSLTPEQLSFYGIHSERGQESISHLMRITAGHDINHVRQLEAIAAGTR